MATLSNNGLNDPMYETFNLGIFILGILAAAVMLLILPIGFIFKSTVILYAALFGTAVYFVMIYMMTAGSKRP
ncbi:hypothetical protein [Azospirillum sp. TSO35-2]|uniref:hypothetical protein n=1 Tax=Azospirillum sp. TSO35-2 TaxID=716796 RepID=UPI000D60BF67|nr:hypothetical protein [Azospirillum sp. TSO35-2]PWC35862.1 hypothetical protein TSO352_11580 [Azospirillum sp. TSO35-2]